jgi:hypothetical protein
MRYGKKPSEFGVPRESTAWRARGPPISPMAATEAGTQIMPDIWQFFPSLTRAQPYGGHFSNPLPCSDYTAGHCKAVVTPGNMLLCFIPHVQPGTGTAYW